jgi:hypothetical protein
MGGMTFSASSHVIAIIQKTTTSPLKMRPNISSEELSLAEEEI